MNFLTTTSGQIIVGLLFINLTAFFIMARDKRKATRGHNAERAPEGMMFFLASVFGAIGVYVAMLLLRHKTRKWYFQIGIPFLIFENMAAAYVLWRLVTVMLG